MIGNIILWIKSLIKQQTCLHDYQTINRKDTGGSFEYCGKCGLIN